MAAKLCDIPSFEKEKNEGLSKSSILHYVMFCYIFNALTSNIAYRASSDVGGGGEMWEHVAI